MTPVARPLAALLLVSCTSLLAACAGHTGRSLPMKTVYVENHTLEYVGLGLTFQGGAAMDPPGKEGLAYLTANMLLKGTGQHDREALGAAFDFVGTNIGISVGQESIQVTVDCSTRNLDKVLGLTREAVAESIFPEEELEKLKRQTIAELVEMRDSDSGALRLFFSALLFEGHPYGVPTRGYAESLQAITREDVLAFHRRVFSGRNLLVGVAGDLAPEAAESLHGYFAAALPEGEALPETAAVPEPEAGLRVLLVTKPDRSQAQIAIGQAGIRGSDPRLFPAMVAVTGFGGTFTSVLVREIREKRGWSYGVGAALVPGRNAGLFQVRYAPANGDVVPSIELTLELLRDLAQNGLPADELEFARKYLVNQYPFMFDTPLKRLELDTNVILSGKPADYVERFVERVGAVTEAGALEAMGGILQTDRLTIVVVGDESLAESLKALPGIASFRTVPYTWDGPLPR
jgi:zinc protease